MSKARFESTMYFEQKTFLLAAVFALIFSALATNADAETVYVLSEDLTDPLTLTVTVARPGESGVTRLVLRGTRFGVQSQIASPLCDGTALTFVEEGEWQLPTSCQQVSWNVVLESAALADASAQRSIASRGAARFTLISEASSLARLDDAEQPELLQLPTERSGTTFPRPDENGRIMLPPFSQAPLFVLMDSEPILSRSDGGVSLAYFIDDPLQRSQLPNIDAHMRGLTWISNLVPSTEPRVFQVVWLGVASDAPTVGGAEGTGLLLSNYRRTPGSPQPLHIAMYIPLHEAFHQIGGGLENKPAWVGESLATYIAARALRYALDDALEAVEVYEEFLSHAERVPLGLLEISRQIEAGDRSQYDAFYSKGLAFWDAVNRTMLTAHGDGLETRLTEIVTADFNDDGCQFLLHRHWGLVPLHGNY